MDQPGKVANPTCGQLNRKKNVFSPSPCSRLRMDLASRDSFGLHVPRQPAYLPHLGAIWCLLTGLLPLSETASIYLDRKLSSGQSRVYRVTYLRTEGVRHRESAVAGPGVFNASRVTDAAFSNVTMDQFCAPLFPPTYYWYLYGV